MKVRRGYDEDPDAARDRHFAAHPEDRGADVVIFEFYDDKGEQPTLWLAGWASVRTLNIARIALRIA